MRIITIGDIHGNHRALQQVLERVNYSPDDKLICVGDYVDGWPESDKVVDTLLHLQEQGGEPNIYIKGNHDDWFINFLNADIHLLDIEKNYDDPFKGHFLLGAKYQHWFTYGGKATYKSYEGKQEKAEKHLEKFFNQLKVSYIYPEDIGPDKSKSMVWVHGGWPTPPGFDLTCLYDPDKLYWNRSMWERALHLRALQDKGYVVGDSKLNIENFHRIFIGHTQTITEYGGNSKVPLKLGNIVNVDQGAGWDWKLTAWIYDTETQEETYIQSDIATDLYPNYQGRKF